MNTLNSTIKDDLFEVSLDYSLIGFKFIYKLHQLNLIKNYKVAHNKIYVYFAYDKDGHCLIKRFEVASSRSMFCFLFRRRIPNYSLIFNKVEIIFFDGNFYTIKEFSHILKEYSKHSIIKVLKICEVYF